MTFSCHVWEPGCIVLLCHAVSMWFPAFAEWGSERVEEHTPPVDGDEASVLYHGWKRGIQGHLNSCYLDATLFR